MKKTYHFCDNYRKKNERIKQEFIDAATNVDDKSFEKDEKRLRNHYNEMIEINFYIEQLLNYIIDHKINFYDYYLMVANNYCNNIENVDFEKQNPFVRKKDIEYLIQSKDKDEPSIFAKELSKIVEEQLSYRMEKE